MKGTWVRLRSQAWWAVVLLGTGCGGTSMLPDAAVDARADGVAESGADAAVESGIDAASVDTGTVDAAGDVGADADAAADAATSALAWSPCVGDPASECAALDVPVDYAQPSGSTTRLAVRRYRARLPNDRRGSILFNPGGPGASATLALPGFASQLLSGAGELLLHYDLVAFDGRGTGSSGAIRCLDDAAFDRFRLLNTVQPDDAGTTARAAQDYVTGCTGGSDGSQFSHVDTATAARDMEQVRIALGEDRLNYLGISAGTRLGATYATLFPDRVRAFVLDSSMRPSADALADLAQDAARSEQSLADFAAWCDADSTCPVHAASGGGATLDAIDTLLARLAVAPLVVGTRAISDGEAADGIIRALQEGPRARLANVLAAALGGDGGPLLQWVDDELRRHPDGTYEPFFQPHSVIAATDSPLPADLTDAQFAAFVHDTLVPGAPRVGPWIANDLPTAISIAWPRRGQSPVPPAHAPTAAPLLIINSRDDGITPLADARAMQSALGNGSYLLESDTPGHAQLIRSACARARAAAFILDPGTPPDVSACPAEPPAPDDTVLGTVTDVFARGAADAMRTQETALGDLVADAIRARGGTQIAVINGGGIRADLPSSYLPANTALRRPAAGYAAGPPYDLVVSDVDLALPFHNRVTTMTVTGAQLFRMLETAVSALPAGGSSFLQVSGLQFSYSASAPAQSRIRAVTLDDGTQVAPDATTYTLSLPDYVYYGGAGFPFLADGTAVVHDELSEALMAYVRAHAPLMPATSNRITALP